MKHTQIVAMGFAEAWRYELSSDLHLLHAYASFSFVHAKYVICDMFVGQQPALLDFMFHLGLYQLA